MKVLLIQPDEFTNMPHPVIAPPLALQCLAAHLEQHEVKILDLRVDEQPLQEHLLNFQPQVVGVTCSFTVGLRVAQKVLCTIRSILPQAKIVVGGVHASLQPGDFAYPLADYVVRGSGERTFSMLIDVLANGGDHSTIPGLYLLEENEAQFTGPRPADWKWSQTYRLPARHLTAHYEPQYSRAATGETMALIISSRGCHQHCNFCACWKLQDGTLDSRDPTCIFNEIISLKDEIIYFFDDNTFSNRRPMRALGEMLLEKGVKKKYQIWTSTDVITRDVELIRLWREAGLIKIFTGFDGIKDQQLQRLGKKNQSAKNEEALMICRDLGIDLSPTFIVTPEFTKSDFDDLDYYVKRLQIRMPWFAILTPLPGTELFYSMAPDILEGDPTRYDLLHLTFSPLVLTPENFLASYIKLYVGNDNWQKAAAAAPIYGEYLQYIKNLDTEPIYKLPIHGFDPQMKAFPRDNPSSTIEEHPHV